jgi:orotidine-5'-phosphate decarboxylase
MLLPRDRLIVALDVESREKAIQYVRLLKADVRMFKVGLELFVSAGPDLVRQMVDEGSSVFLDLKLHDIPNQVSRAVAAATRLGVSMLTLHALGGWKMMHSASEMAAETAARLGIPKPLLLGVTVLTSLDEAQLRLTGIAGTLPSAVHRLACIAEASGMDGVVASPHEARLIRESLPLSFVLVTPGVRPAGSRSHDQSRTMSPREALEQGADYLVIGRPILESADPCHAAQLILAEMHP